MNKSKRDKRIEVFENAVYRYQKLLGFEDVEITIMESDNKRGRGLWEGSTVAGQVTICFTDHFIDDPDTTNEEIDKVAFHETFEAQFYEIYPMLNCFYSVGIISEKIHRMVRRMENKIYPILKDKEA